MSALFVLAALAAPPVASAPAAPARTILFVGNSFTFGALSPLLRYRAETVRDLNGDGIGGVPALFQRFADESGLTYQVSLETAPGRSLEWHWQNRRALLDRGWDAVVLQDYSTLDPERAGNPAKHITYSGLIAKMVRARNPHAQLSLTATWSRPDLTLLPGKPWSGKPITAMAVDLRHAADAARLANPAITRVHPVGEAFSCAIARGIADANPYDGTSFGQIDLWARDQYHASAAGYYLEALTIFAGVTGRDPRALGANEKAADDLGLGGELASRLQSVAWQVSLGGGCRLDRR